MKKTIAIISIIVILISITFCDKPKYVSTTLNFTGEIKNIDWYTPIENIINLESNDEVLNETEEGKVLTQKNIKLGEYRYTGDLVYNFDKLDRLISIKFYFTNNEEYENYYNYIDTRYGPGAENNKIFTWQGIANNLPTFFRTNQNEKSIEMFVDID